MKKLIYFLPLFIGYLSMAKEISINSKPVSLRLPPATGCAIPTTYVDLDISNVRARIMVAGDMWWDLSGSAQYEVPKNSGKNSMFTGAFWFGGYDGNGNLKVAAQTYRQTGSDFWGGPIGLNSGIPDITAQRCLQFDKIWKVTKADVQNFINTGTATPDITSWPGNGDLSAGELAIYAPFEDINGDGIYSPASGDYPKYNFTNNYSFDTICQAYSCNGYIFGDQSLWWVFNDVGNIKNETQSAAVALEVRAQAFSFVTGTGIDNCTFYKYQIINRSGFTYDSTYIGSWSDPDLGNYNDDFVGCDVNRGVGYCYNGDLNDDLPDGYGLKPPAVGIDFLQGPLADVGDGIDNDRDGSVDEACEQIIMSGFRYYSNDFTITGNPDTTDDFYQYLSGTWKDATLLTFGGTGYNPLSVSYTNFMFSNGTDPSFPGQYWNEISSGNIPFDRRFLMAAGPFTMLPGQVEYVTTSVVWARDTLGGSFSSVNSMLALDDTVQAFFNSCFNVTQLALVNADKELRVICSPNPFNRSTIIKIQNQNDNNLSLQLNDLNGRIVESQRTSTGQFDIEKKNKPAGIYFYSVKSDKKIIASGKLVIN